jgi:hypothetical protein
MVPALLAGFRSSISLESARQTFRGTFIPTQCLRFGVGESSISRLSTRFLRHNENRLGRTRDRGDCYSPWVNRLDQKFSLS